MINILDIFPKRYLAVVTKMPHPSIMLDFINRVNCPSDIPIKEHKKLFRTRFFAKRWCKSFGVGYPPLWGIFDLYVYKSEIIDTFDVAYKHKNIVSFNSRKYEKELF